MHATNIRLRDFIVTDNDWIFAASGYDHTGGVQAVLRYIPDQNGDREMSGIRYRKLDFDESGEFMEKNHPSWKFRLPEDAISKVLRSNDRIPSLAKEDPRVAVIVDVLKSAGIPVGKMGVTGSMLPGLQIEGSDIDFVVYGRYWFLARDAIRREILRNLDRGRGTVGGRDGDRDRDSDKLAITEISEEMWHQIYAKRVPEISFEEFLAHELRKGNRGMIGGTYFDLLFVRDWDQLPVVQERGADLRRCSLTAQVLNTDFAFDSPAVYEIDHPVISEILCYTHTYAGQALAGEVVEARGMLEDVHGQKRLVVGTSREPVGEWMRSLSLLDRVPPSEE
ncbi:MAG: DNA polymerase subunit beta [Euryarchaeota archaeon]|nr:DNA polymerase subunit beta [Euryarchaeota archaeon]